MLSIKNLNCTIDGKTILTDISLGINRGEIHILMGPNGSGKSTLARTIVGFPEYVVGSGEIKIDTKEITKLPIDKRAQLGLFMGFQQPIEVPGVSFRNFLRIAFNTGKPKSKQISTRDFAMLLDKTATKLDIPTKLLDRDLNFNLSGGEKKKMEVLQMAILQPKYVILDEIDSGLDIDANKVIYKTVKKLAKEFDIGILIITHYEKILEQITPDYVHIIKEGKIVEHGSKALIERISHNGYKAD